MRSGKSKKFWEITLEGSSYVVRYGRIGSTGTEKTTTCAGAAEARVARDKLVAAKEKKGYSLVQDTAAESVPSRGAEQPSDRARIAAFFRSIDSDQVIALPPSRRRLSQSIGHEEALERAHGRGIDHPTYVFWHAQAGERAFDKDGALVGALSLHWGGDHARVAAALASLPADYCLSDGGPQSSFSIRPKVPDAGTDLGDAVSIKRRLNAIDRELEQDYEAGIAWLHTLAAAPILGQPLQALRVLCQHGEAQTEELELVGSDLVAHLKEEGFDDDPTFFEQLRTRCPAVYAKARADLRRQRKRALIELWCRMVSGDPWTAEVETRLRQLSETKEDRHGNLWLVADATDALIRILAARDQRPEVTVALDLSEDETFSPTARAHFLEYACGTYGYREEGCLKLAEDDELLASPRRKALERACRFLEFRATPEDVDRVDRLVAAGLTVSERAQQSLQAARKYL